MGLEPTTITLASGEHPTEVIEEQGVGEAAPDACTNACTNSPETNHSDTLERLAEAVRLLTPDERDKLAEMLRPGDGPESESR